MKTPFYLILRRQVFILFSFILAIILAVFLFPLLLLITLLGTLYLVFKMRQVRKKENLNPHSTIIDVTDISEGVIKSTKDEELEHTISQHQKQAQGSKIERLPPND